MADFKAKHCGGYFKNNRNNIIKNKSHNNKKESEKEVLFGRNACFGCLNGNNREVCTIYLLSTKWNEYYNLIPEKHKLLCRKCDAHEMFSIAHDDKHQGIALKVSKYNFLSIDDLLLEENDSNNTYRKQTKALFLLDRVQDPHNVGNIIRTAYCLNIDGIVLTDRSSCGITNSVVRTSAGYSEKIKIYKTNNAVQAVEKLKQKGYCIIGFDVNTNTKDDLRGVINQYDKCVFIFGSEGDGVRDLLKKTCDIIVKLPMREDAESLNVANTTAIVGWEWMNKLTI